MPNPVDPNLFLNRHYRISFFDVAGSGPFTIKPIGNMSIKDSVNFSFSYDVNVGTQNTATFRFDNLDQYTIDLFGGGRNRRGFILEAWYNNEILGNNTIFRGLTFTVQTYREGADIVTEVTGCDIFLNLMAEGAALSFPAGTSYLSVVQALLTSYGNVAVLSSYSKTLLTGVYKSPKTFCGPLNHILKKVAADAGVIFSYTPEGISMIPKGLSTAPSASFQRLNNTNGLVGYPRAEALSIQLFSVTYFDNVDLNKNISIVSATSLLRPYRPYDKIRLESEYFNAFYRVLSVKHYGEWRGNPWYSSLTLVPIVET